MQDKFKKKKKYKKKWKKNKIKERGEREITFFFCGKNIHKMEESGEFIVTRLE